MNECLLNTDIFHLSKAEDGSEKLLALIKNNLDSLKNRYIIIFENSYLIMEGVIEKIYLKDRLINISVRTRIGIYEYNLAVSTEIFVSYQDNRFYLDITQNDSAENEYLYPFLEFSIVILK